MAKFNEMYISSSFRPGIDNTKYFKNGHEPIMPNKMAKDIFEGYIPGTNMPNWHHQYNAKILGNVLSSENTENGVHAYIKLNQEGRKFFNELEKTNEVRSMEFVFDEPYELMPDDVFEYLDRRAKEMILKKEMESIEKAIDKVKFSECKRTGAITTIIFWKDGTKTMAKPSEEDSFDPFVGFDICVLKKLFGNNSHHKRVYRDFVDDAWDEFMEDKMRRENEERKFMSKHVLYRCDRTKCRNCSYPDCEYTTDIEHAVNFVQTDGLTYSEVIPSPDRFEDAVNKIEIS